MLKMGAYLVEKKKADLLKRLEELKAKRNAIILAHNYQIEEVQDVADFVGDSFELSRMAAGSRADVIVFCGVHFMAEGAAILAPDKEVLLPDLMAGCPLADMVTAEALREKKKQHPRATVVTYINSSAEVKAESDICVTSSNAVAVIKSLEAEEILFVPDKNLGNYVASQTGKQLILWNGYCITHHRVTREEVVAARKAHPDAIVLVHPECRPEVVEAADYAFSTGGMIRFARETTHKKLIIGTEMGLIYRLQKENPQKEFYLLSQGLICPNMKYTTLEKVVNSLETMQHRITVPEHIREPARRALERMLAAV